nr:MAG TPA: hypothetical protein [Caudoviricetes sp.]
MKHFRGLGEKPKTPQMKTELLSHITLVILVSLV